ncbi:MAG: UDP-N-acetylmuramoyl-L-alanyl-D-glutamate--2,6-diaminopimelate ligase [Pseudomonadota bacterium]|mgnify:CR=1 FL=1|nr:UDP-N-acetylmuramoyl-L-alanyl-D-glutamate--2,6-diaminopimelate ligase [Pseudomonadota bacterium]|tara:strand:+ start:40537 stop:41946 length:1410 start_codon:yes stop_codon:yes gene_type:complete
MKENNKNIDQILNFVRNNLSGNLDIDKALAWNSKVIKKGQIFVSVKTKLEKRYNYIKEALSRGAKAIISDVQLKNNSELKNIPVLYCKYLKDNHNKFLNHIYKNPLNNIKVIGVTGTDGKTSQLHLLAQSLSLSGKKIGVISSEGNGIYPRLKKSNYTTPSFDILFKYFKKFSISKVNIVLIECSSQGIQQGRVDDIKFDLSILTNINKDHIDYHGSFKNYIVSKMKLLNMTKRHIFINKDCITTKKNMKLITTKAHKHFFNYDLNLKEKFTTIKLLGTVSDYYNICVIQKILLLQKISDKRICQIISQLKPIVGRNQFVRTKNKGTYVIDYAHTPSSLSNLLRTTNFFSIVNNGKLITVFGCGGDRDVWKRQAMGNVSSKFSNHIILTDDNPRNEDSMKIINDIKKGVNQKISLSIIPSRKKAIKKAVSIAKKNDFIVIAGKGNENEIKYKKNIIKHNDFKVLKAILK